MKKLNYLKNKKLFNYVNCKKTISVILSAMSAVFIYNFKNSAMFTDNTSVGNSFSNYSGEVNHVEYYTNGYGQTIPIELSHVVFFDADARCNIDCWMATPRLTEDYFLSDNDPRFYWDEDDKLRYESENGLSCGVYGCEGSDDTHRFDIYVPKYLVTLPGGTKLVTYCASRARLKVATVVGQLYPEDENLFTYDEYFDYYYVLVLEDGRYLSPAEKAQIDPYNDWINICKCNVWNFASAPRAR